MVRTAVLIGFVCVVTVAYAGSACDEAREYFAQLPVRFEREAQTLASLTGWDINEIRRTANLTAPSVNPKPWWQNLWKREPGGAAPK